MDTYKTGGIRRHKAETMKDFYCLLNNADVVTTFALGVQIKLTKDQAGEIINHTLNHHDIRPSELFRDYITVIETDGDGVDTWMELTYLKSSANMGKKI